MIHIQPYSDNAKKHPKKQVEQIAESIKRFGMNQPIVVGYTKVAQNSGLKLLAWNVWNRIHPRTVAQNTAFIPIAHEWIFVYGKSDTEVKKTKVSLTAGGDNSGAIHQKDGSLTYRSYKTNPLKKITSVTTTGVESSGIHPAMFPVALAEEYILAMAPQTVIDPFLGGGTTLIAAEKSNRVCYGMELDPLYVDIVVQRYVDYVDNPVVLLNGNNIVWEKTAK